MKTHAPAPSQFTLSEILFATVLTFLGMSVLNSVTFTDNPALGCAVALIATIVCGKIVLIVTRPRSMDRFFVALILYGVTVCVLRGLLELSRGHGVEFFAYFICFVLLPIGASFVLSLIVWQRHLFSDYEQPDRIRLIFITTVFLSPIAGVVSFSHLYHRPRTPAYETAAAAACKAYAEAQEIHHRTDYDGDGVLEYAQSMFGANSLVERKEGTEDLLLIDPAFSEAAWEHPSRRPKAGYFYKSLHAGGCAVGSYVDDAGNQTRGYAMLAVPAIYDGTGRTSYMINNTGVIYQKDLGPNTLSIAAGITDFALDPTWIPTE